MKFMIVAVIVSLGATLELCSFAFLEKYRQYAGYPVDTEPALVQNTQQQRTKLSFESAHKHTE